jgi:hypothetical protein
MNGRNPVMERSMQLLTGGYRGDTNARLKTFADWEAIGALTPLDARILIHGQPLRLGIGRQTVTDYIAGPQYGISYGRLGSVEAIDQRLKSFGVTHVAWAVPEDTDSLAGELLFRIYAQVYGARPLTSGGWTVARLPEKTPKRPPEKVLVFGCNGYPYRTGLYSIERLAQARPEPNIAQQQFIPDKTAEDPMTLLPEATAVANESGCAKTINLSGFKALGARSATPVMDFYVRP